LIKWEGPKPNTGEVQLQLCRVYMPSGVALVLLTSGQVVVVLYDRVVSIPMNRGFAVAKRGKRPMPIT
jgi:hypothetical protein